MRNNFRLMMGGEIVDYFRTLEAAQNFGQRVNLNRTRSSGGKKKKQIIQVYHDMPEGSKLVHEEAH